jgi:hypothetical protein
MKNKKSPRVGMVLTIAAVLSILSIIKTDASAQETIEGNLQFLKTKNGETFLAIDSTKKLVTKGDDGRLLESKLVQIAGLDEANWRDALKLVGKNVSATGKPMGAMTKHHHTPVLLIASEVIEQNKPVLDQGNERPNRNDPNRGGPNNNQNDNEQQGSSHSKEW